MENNRILNLKINTPSFVIDKELIRKNIAILAKVINSTDCKILLALKAFSMYSAFDEINKTLCGTCASSVHEAMLGKQEFGGEVHIYAAAYSDKDFDELLKIADHISFNSFSQWKNFRNKAMQAKKQRNIEFGLRINPEHSEGVAAIYNPCAPFSRMGITINNFEPDELKGISFLHFHTLCEQNAEPLQRTLKAFVEKFEKYIPQMKYINFGGGHHITKSDYNIELLIKLINDFKNKFNVQVYLEPGEAVVLNSGYLVSSVLDIINNGMDIAIMDTSAACHMPDVIEMPYRPYILNSAEPEQKKYTYRLGGPTCLAGDIIGDYSFDEKLKIGDKLIFTDMALYSMVKTNTFNGINLPDIVLYDSKNDEFKVVNFFGYDDFKSRL